MAKNDREDTTPRRRGGRIRRLPSRMLARYGWMRRRYARRMIKTIEKYKKKHRPLPDSLLALDRQLRRLPPHKRQEILEQMIEAGGGTDTDMGRDLRRAAGRQDRQSGRGGGLRPGQVPAPHRRPRPR